MDMAVGQVGTNGVHSAREPRPNFGSLVSAINKGDVDAAQNAFAGLIDLAPKAAGPLRKGALDAMRKALDEADLDAAKKALKDFQQGMQTKAAVPDLGETSKGLRYSAITISILV